ncbi:CBN-RPN-2 protein [Caenorhabditis brenneri]|uniref:26S proteasome non-ATPase regulatory subunit 1 n=1 Tax=Caenorhabditis brenneri TaxID=135651 RepID=G0N2Q7_CAEBE|nr:CBN-RPN-2 protein [Caenorhabditis brenneri]
MLTLLNRWRSQPGGATNAAAFIRVLESPKSSVSDKVLVLRAFNDWDVLVNTWFEVADALPAVEKLLDVSTFPEHSSAALLVSKVYFCLEQYDRALEFALRGDFNVVPAPRKGLGNDAEYVNKVIETAIDTYKAMSQQNMMPPQQLRDLIDKIVSRNLDKKEIWYVISLGFETRNLEMISRAIGAMPADLNIKNQTTLVETLNRVVNGAFDRSFRFQVIDIVISTYLMCPSPDMSKICECYVLTDNADSAADTILSLIKRTLLTRAFQIAFDLYETASQGFLDRVLKKLHEQETSDAKAMEKIDSILKGHETVKAYLDFYVRHNHTDTVLMEEIKENIRTASAHNALLISNGLMQYGTTCDDFLRNNLTWVSKATNWNKFNAVASLGLIHHGQEASAMKVLDPYLPKESVEGFGFKEGGAMLAYGLIHAKHGDATAMSTLAQWLRTADNEPVRHGACLGFGVAGLGSSSMSGYEKVREVLQRDEAVSGESAGIAMGLIMAGNLNQEVFNELKQYTVDTQHDKTQRGIRTGLACAAFGLQGDAEPYIQEAISAKSNPMLRSTGICMLSMAYAGTGSPEVVRRLLEKVATDPNLDVKRYATIGIGFVLSKDPTTCLSYVSMLTEHFNGHVRYGAAMALGIACAATGNMEAIALIEPMISDKEGFVRKGALLSLALIMCQQTDYTCPKVNGFRKQLLKKVGEKNEDSLVKFGAIIAQGLLDIGGQNAAVTMHNSDGQPDMGSMVGMMCFLHGWFWHSMHFFVALAAKPSCLVLVNENLKIPVMEYTCHANSQKFAYPPRAESKKDKDVKKIETVVLSITGKKNALKKAAAAEEKRRREAAFNALSAHLTPALSSSSTSSTGTAASASGATTASAPAAAAAAAPASSSSTATTTTATTASAAPTTATMPAEDEKMEVDQPGKMPKKEKAPEKDNKPLHRLQNPARVIPAQRQLLSITDLKSYFPMKPLYKGGIIVADRVDKEREEKLVSEVVSQVTAPVITGGSSTECKPHSTFEINLGDY